MTACWIVNTVSGLTASDSDTLNNDIFLSNSVALFFMGLRTGGGESSAVKLAGRGIPWSVVQAAVST